MPSLVDFPSNCGIRILHCLGYNAKNLRSHLKDSIHGRNAIGIIATTNPYQKNLHKTLADFKFKQIRTFTNRMSGRQIIIWFRPPQ